MPGIQNVPSYCWTVTSQLAAYLVDGDDFLVHVRLEVIFVHIENVATDFQRCGHHRPEAHLSARLLLCHVDRSVGTCPNQSVRIVPSTRTLQM